MSISFSQKKTKRGYNYMEQDENNFSSSNVDQKAQQVLRDFENFSFLRNDGFKQRHSTIKKSPAEFDSYQAKHSKVSKLKKQNLLMEKNQFDETLDLGNESIELKKQSQESYQNIINMQQNFIQSLLVSKEIQYNNRGNTNKNNVDQLRQLKQIEHSNNKLTKSPRNNIDSTSLEKTLQNDYNELNEKHQMIQSKQQLKKWNNNSKNNYQIETSTNVNSQQWQSLCQGQMKESLKIKEYKTSSQQTDSLIVEQNSQLLKQLQQKLSNIMSPAMEKLQYLVENKVEFLHFKYLLVELKNRNFQRVDVIENGFILMKEMCQRYCKLEQINDERVKQNQQQIQQIEMMQQKFNQLEQCFKEQEDRFELKKSEIVDDISNQNENNIFKLQTALIQMEEQYSCLQQQLHISQQKNITLEQNQQTIEKKLVQKDEKIHNYQKDLTDLSSELDQQLSQIDELKQKNVQLQSRIQQQNKEIDNQIQQLEQLNNIKATDSQKVNQLIKQNDSQKNEIDTLNEQLMQQQQFHNDQIKKLNLQIQQDKSNYSLQFDQHSMIQNELKQKSEQKQKQIDWFENIQKEQINLILDSLKFPKNKDNNQKIISRLNGNPQLNQIFNRVYFMLDAEQEDFQIFQKQIQQYFQQNLNFSSYLEFDYTKDHIIQNELFKMSKDLKEIKQSITLQNQFGQGLENLDSESRYTLGNTLLPRIDSNHPIDNNQLNLIQKYFNSGDENIFEPQSIHNSDFDIDEFHAHLHSNQKSKF